MIFWNEKKLAVRLRDDMVSAKEQLVYLALNQIILTLFATAILSHAIHSQALNIYDYVLDASMMIITLICVIYPYCINNRGDSKDFVTRYMCISTPIAIKAFLISLLFSIPVFLLDTLVPFFLANPEAAIKADEAELNKMIEQMFDKMDFGPGPFTIGAVFIVYAFVVWRYKVSFKIASGQTARETVNV